MSGGLHGVGASVVNALSEWLEVEIYQGGKIYKQRYERGKVIYKLKVIGECDPEKTGTKLHFSRMRKFLRRPYLITMCSNSVSARWHF